MLPLVGAAAVIAVLGLLPAATAAAVRYETARNPRVFPSTLRLAFWAVIQWGGVTMVLLSLPQILLPPYIGVIVSALLVSFLFLALLSQRQESVALLNESVRVICRRGGSLADMAEAFARGDPSVLAGRARRFADAVRRGVPADQAARGVRLPLNAETMLALDHRGQAQWRSAGQEADAVYRARDFPRATWPVASQAAYFLTVLVGIILVSSFLMLLIVPTLEQMSYEFDIETPVTLSSIEQRAWMEAMPLILLVLLLGWGALQLLYWMTDWSWVARLLPLTGPLLRSRRRSSSLRGLAAAIDAGSEASQALAMASNSGFRPGETSRLRRAAVLAAAGNGLGKALHQAGLVDARQRPWIDAALPVGRAAEALRGVAEAAERYARIRVEVMATVLFPLGVIGCGLLILWVANLVFGSLVRLIDALA